MTRTSARAPLVFGYATIALLLGGIGAWSIGTEISGAVVASGTVRVESDRQVVQHPDGGVVGEIHARDGQPVNAGDPLIRLDDTFILSELAIIERQLLELHARKARLAAERDGQTSLVIPDSPISHRLDATWITDQFLSQHALFDARLTAHGQELEQLEEQRIQIDQQIAGVDAQLEALGAQRDLIAGERSDLEGLLKQGLIPAARVLELRREEARIQGELGRLTSEIAEARTRQSGLRIEALRLTERRRENAISTLGDLRFNEIELEERRLGLVEQLDRLDLRAPVDGTVFGSRIFALGAVIRPADPVMYIVPGSQPLQISARIDPIDVDQVYADQPVTLVFSTFNQRTTPEIEGQVLRVSADAITDQATGARFYEAIIVPDTAAISEVAGLELKPGMPVEAFLRTQSRQPLTYLTQPLTVYFARAFRED